MCIGNERKQCRMRRSHGHIVQVQLIINAEPASFQFLHDPYLDTVFPE